MTTCTPSVPAAARGSAHKVPGGTQEPLSRTTSREGGTVTRRTRPMAHVVALGSLVLLGCDATGPDPGSGGLGELLPPPSSSPDETVGIAVLAGGCFWGVEAVFEAVKGVSQVVSGFAGGTAATAHYDLVVLGVTDHAEVVEVHFDPQQISYAQILHIFFSVAHDPTQLNRQHPDVGPQYRSNVFFLDDAQRQAAVTYIGELNAAGVFPRPIVTRVDSLDGFYPAEEHHQDFVIKNPHDRYVLTYDLPKLANLQRLFPHLYEP
jgi:peptide-methionine (S)-S-oxide reductase